MVIYFLKSGLGVLNPHVLIRGFLLYTYSARSRSFFFRSVVAEKVISITIIKIKARKVSPHLAYFLPQMKTQ